MALWAGAAGSENTKSADATVTNPSMDPFSDSYALHDATMSYMKQYQEVVDRLLQEIDYSTLSMEELVRENGVLSYISKKLVHGVMEAQNRETR